MRRRSRNDAVNFTIDPATEVDLADVATWVYGPPYEFYDRDTDGHVENPERFYAARGADGELVGFFYFEEQGEWLEYGLGLRPDLTGGGLGLEFVEAGREFGRSHFRPDRVKLNVAAFNERALTVYERAGFQVVGSHVRHFDRWGDVEFIEMKEP
jgi:[ribosomal protein S18]-alanine N-acetyltransferase